MELNLLSSDQVDALNRLIDGAENIVLVCHARPDGDSLGSALGWAEYLTTVRKKKPAIVAPNAFPDFLQWLPGSERVVRYDKHADEVVKMFKRAQLVCCMDFNAYERVDEMTPVLQQCDAPIVMIDHHPSPTLPCSVSISEPELCSTSEVIFRVVWQLGGFELLTKKFAVPVYCGMMTDTGGFTYNSTRPEIYFIICQLLTKKIDKDKIYRNVFNNFSSWAIRLRGYLMSQKLNVFPEQHATFYSISREEMSNFHFVRGDVEGLVNEPLRIKGIRMSISLREDDRADNRVWVSLRSVDNFSVEDIAKRFFNGGGHLNASGGRLDCSLQEAEKVAREAVAYFGRQFLPQEPNA